MLFLAGAISGIVETLVVQPLDMVKTRFQLNEGKNVSVVGGLRAVIQEGGFVRFYRGILPELVGNLPAASVLLASYELFKRYLSQLNGGLCDFKVAFTAGFLSGFTESLVVTPFQVVKVRMQAKEYLGFYHNSYDCMWQLLRTEGLPSLMIGLGPSFWRNCTWNSVYFSLLFLQTKSLFPSARSFSAEVTQTFVGGAIAGAIATVFAAPFDMVKSRFQRELRGTAALERGSCTPIAASHTPSLAAPTSTPTKSHALTPRYRHTTGALVDIWRAEGLRAVYKGLTPQLMRMTLGGGVCMTAFDMACRMLPKTGDGKGEGGTCAPHGGPRLCL